MDTCPACNAVMHTILSGGDTKFTLHAAFHNPIVGLGAPVSFFTEGIPERVEAEIVIPPHADVANAIGAITSFVTVTKRFHIVPTVEGLYSVQGLPESPGFIRFNDAREYAVKMLENEIVAMAEAAGTSEDQIHMHIEDRISNTADGEELFLEQIIAAEITGPPDLA